MMPPDVDSCRRGGDEPPGVERPDGSADVIARLKKPDN
jgi:hypothetical protein